MFRFFITTDSMISAGGLSSASLEEAVSWGKVNVEAPKVTVHCDATIALPILMGYLKSVCP